MAVSCNHCHFYFCSDFYIVKQLNSSNSYRTILSTGSGLYKEKGSKFLGFAFSCSTEKQLKENLDKLRKEHPQACHVCYAFRLGSDKKRYRASDDGEPNNSAGAPILGQIQSFDLTNVLVAVVRYYGGTNLGVGGLINAYRTAAKEAIEQSDIIEKEDEIIVDIQFSYNQLPTVMNYLKMNKFQTITQQLELVCKIQCSVPISQLQAIGLFISQHELTLLP